VIVTITSQIKSKTKGVLIARAMLRRVCGVWTIIGWISSLGFWGCGLRCVIHGHRRACGGPQFKPFGPPDGYHKYQERQAKGDQFKAAAKFVALIGGGGAFFGRNRAMTERRCVVIARWAWRRMGFEEGMVTPKS
jgi:hypothetical protein